MRRRLWRGIRAVALGLALLAAMSMPASVDSTQTHTTAAAQARTIKIMTWNVCGGCP